MVKTMSSKSSEEGLRGGDDDEQDGGPRSDLLKQLDEVRQELQVDQKLLVTPQHIEKASFLTILNSQGLQQQLSIDMCDYLRIDEPSFKVLDTFVKSVFLQGLLQGKEHNSSGAADCNKLSEAELAAKNETGKISAAGQSTQPKHELMTIDNGTDRLPSSTAFNNDMYLLCNISQILQHFWALRGKEARSQDMSVFSDLCVPRTTVRKIVKLDLEKQSCILRVSKEALEILSKAVALFTEETSLRAFCEATADRRRAVRRSDILAAFHRDESFDFLIDIVGPTEDRRIE